MPSHIMLLGTFLCPFPPQRPTERGQTVEDFSSGWRGFLSSMGLSIPAGLCRLAPPALRLGQRRMLEGKPPEIPEHVLRLAGVGPDKLRAEWTLPGFIAMFLPEFPHRTVPGHENFQVDLNFNLVTCMIFRFQLTCLMFHVLAQHSVSEPTSIHTWDHHCLQQVLSYIAKGSFGPILKVKDKTKQRTYAVKVNPHVISCISVLSHPK